MIKKLFGYAILLALFSWLFVMYATAAGWYHALVVFGISSVTVGILYLAVILITDD